MTSLAAAKRLRAFLEPRWRFGLFALLFLAPILSGLLTRIIKKRSYFADFRQLICAGDHVARGLPLYGPGSACPSLDAMPFVYIPRVAHVSAGFIQVLGRDGFSLLYAALFVGAGVLMFVTLVLDRRVPGAPAERLPTLSLLTGSAVSWGNIALPLAALIGVAATTLETWPLLFVAAVAVSMVVKPLYAACLLPIVFMARSRVERAGLIGLGLVLGLAPLALFLWRGGAAAQAWSFQTQHYVATQAPGFGFLGWQSLLFGYNGVSLWTLIGYGLFAASILASLFMISWLGKLEVRDKVWLSLMVACLLAPRIMRYDVFLMGPGMIVTLYAAQVYSLRAGRVVAGIVYAALFLGLILNFAVGGNQLFLITLMMWGVLVGLAGAFALRRWPWRAASVVLPPLEPFPISVERLSG